MQRKTKGLLALASVLAIGGIAQATNYTLWINGRSSNAQVGNHADFSYWGPATTAAGVNKKSVNWDGYNSIASTNSRVRDALDCYCTGPNWCYVAAHSAGNLQIGYALSLFGTSSRTVRTPTPNSSGQCGASGAGTQTGWNIKWVYVAGGAGGGSELANSGDWALSEPLVSDLKTSTARAMYNHNTTQGKMFYMYAGSKGTLYSFILPGQDDEAIAYHSSGGISGSGGAGYGNPSEWFSNDLTLGTAAAEGGRAKWTNHSVSFRDDREAFNHYNSGNWAGIVGRMRTDVVAGAQ
ncbi:MAG: hypothetical protein ACK5O3_06435 [Burkholderiales bacterium]